MDVFCSTLRDASLESWTAVTSLANCRIPPGMFCCHGASPSIYMERKSYGTIESENMSFRSRRWPILLVRHLQSPLHSNIQHSPSHSLLLFFVGQFISILPRIGNWRDVIQGFYSSAIYHKIIVTRVRAEKLPAQRYSANCKAQYGRELCTHLNIFFGRFFSLVPARFNSKVHPICLSLLLHAIGIFISLRSYHGLKPALSHPSALCLLQSLKILVEFMQI